MSSTTPTPRVNSSSLPSPAANSNKPLPSSTQSQLTSALLTSSSISRIEAQLAHDLAACGWTANLRTHVTQLLRTGECSTYNECLVKVLAAVRAANSGSGAAASDKKKDGDKDKVQDKDKDRDRDKDKADLAVPALVLKDGVRSVKKEVESVCILRVDDVDD